MTIEEAKHINLQKLLDNKDSLLLKDMIVAELKNVLNSSEDRLGKQEFNKQLLLVKRYAGFAWSNYLKYKKARTSPTKYKYAWLVNKHFSTMRIHLDELLNMQTQGAYVLPNGDIYKTNLIIFEKEFLGHNRRYTKIISDFKNWSPLAINMGTQLANINQLFNEHIELSKVNFGWRGEVLAKMAQAQIKDWSVQNIIKYGSTSDNMRATIFEDIYDSKTGTNIRVKTFGGEAGGLKSQAEFCQQIVLSNNEFLINYLDIIKEEIYKSITLTRPASWIPKDWQS